MPVRRDAAMALVHVAHGLDRVFANSCGSDSVWTFGDIRISPGAQSIVPGAADLVVQFRDRDEAVLDRMEAAMRMRVADANAAGPVAVEVAETIHRITPAAMDDSVQACLADAAEHHQCWYASIYSTL